MPFISSENHRRPQNFRFYILTIFVFVALSAVLLPTKNAFADTKTAPYGLQVLINGSPYGPFNVEDGLSDSNQGLDGAYYDDGALDGSEISMGFLPQGWYILSFQELESSWTSLWVGDNPIWSDCSVKYNWTFKGVKIKRTLNEISNAKIYLDYANSDIWNDDTSNWTEAPSFSPLSDYQSPVLKMPKSFGVLGISDYGWVVDYQDIKDSVGSSIGHIYKAHPRDTDAPSVTWKLDFSGGYGGSGQIPSADYSLIRINGSTRYQTMSGLVDLMGSNQNGVMIIASASNYPDALAAASLAGCYDPAPIVLTDPHELSAEVIEQIQKRKPAFIYIVGGESAVSKTVENEIRSTSVAANKDAFIQREAGQTRYDTALKIARTTYAVAEVSQRAPKQVIIATGDNFADALSVSSFAYSNQIPILLCNQNSGLADDALQFLKSKGIQKALILGGNQAVPTFVEHQLSSVGVSFARCSGDTRYETSVNIAKYASLTSSGMQPLSANHSIIATGKNFPDALASGPAAGNKKSFVLLADDGNDSTLNYLSNLIRSGQSTVDNAYIAGGENAISSSLANKFASTLGLQLKN